MAFTFNKSERLCSRNIIEKLFSKGSSGFTLFPFRFSWVETPLDSTNKVQVIFIAAKKRYPQASQRNRVKRNLRELYRLNKHLLYDSLLKNEKQYALMISYIAKDKIQHQEMVKVFNKCLIRLITEFEKADTNTIYSIDKIL